MLVLINMLFDFRYFPYNPDPGQLKKKTDRALELLKQITSIKIDENKMKPREVKALVQVLGCVIIIISQEVEGLFVLILCQIAYFFPA